MTEPHRPKPIFDRSRRVFATCGLAFAGKSTMARRVAAVLQADRVVLDAINIERGLDGGRGLSVSQWEETSAIAMDRVARGLAAGRRIVVDDTFSHRFLRDRLRAVAARGGTAVAFLWADTPLAVIAARRAANNRRPTRPAIDEPVFASHRDGFQFPTPDEEDVVRIGSEDALERWLATAARGVPSPPELG